MHKPLEVMQNKDSKIPDEGFFSVKKIKRKFIFVWFYSFPLPVSKAFKLIKLKKPLGVVINTETIMFYDLHVCTIKVG